MQVNFEQLRDSDAMTREEGELMYALVRALKPDYCVETGTHCGLSSCYIGEALKDNSKGTLLTCDPVEMGQAKNIAEADLDGYVTYSQCRGVDLAVTGPIDFLFIDGYHEKEEVMAEFYYFQKHFHKNTVVVFHDCDFVSGCVNDAVASLGLTTVWLPTKNRMRIYSHRNA